MSVVKNKTFKFILLVVFFVLIPFFSLHAKEIEINFLFSPTCHFCANEKPFLYSLENNNKDIIVNSYDITDLKNENLVKNLYLEYKVPYNDYGSVPMTFIKDKYFVGYNEKIGESIKNYINDLNNEVDHDVGVGDNKKIEIERIENFRNFKIPFFGDIDVNNFSPMMLSITVGALDGFNACAMVALGFLLTVLVGTGSRKKVFIIGSVFILISGLMYFLFITAWLNLFIFVGYIKIVNIIVSLFIIIFSVFVLKDYWTGVVCKMCDVSEGKKENIFTKLQKKLFVSITRISNSEMSLFAMILVVSVVAIGVNLVELVCSLGFPMAYTKILTSYNLSKFSYYFHIFIYVLFYMIDDFIIFCLAIFTLKITNISQKYLKFVKLISGLVLFVLGIIMLIKN
ncbi:MAG: hypothetical protein PHZ07_04455 [Patescibacteria group bacterium]|nr:hypothetical protein [Patescibacteria group bacterium]MDD4303999.1 hypothetical protein [Patescibacteria group bacterium]MDD4695012.1 hypothetical protein [Patescibacteria group bacterium]